MADERVAILLEATNNVSAPARQAAADVAAVGAAAQQAGRNAATLTAAVANTERGMQAVPPRALAAANALSLIAGAAGGATTGAHGLVIAAGAASSGIAALSTSAAAAAPFIGALAVVAGTIYEAWSRANKELEVSASLVKRLGDMSDASVRNQLARIDDRMKVLKTAVDVGSPDAAEEYRQLVANREAVAKRVTEIDRRERERGRTEQEAEGKRAADRARDERRKADDERAKERAEAIAIDIKAATEANRAEILLDEDRFRARKTIVFAETQEQIDRLNAMKTLDDELRDAAIRNVERVRAARSAAIDAERREYQRKVIRGALDDAKTLTQVMIESGNAQIRAIGHAGDALRRIVIGAQAAHAAVESIIEGGKSLGAFASGNITGGALHAAAAVKLAAAAALGARESLGGGGGASAGGGGGGSGGAPSTFEPRNTNAGGFGTIIVNTIDPTSRRVVDTVRYALNRSEILDRPIVGGGGVQVLRGAA